MTRSGRLSRSEVARLPTGSAPELLLSVQLEQAGIPFVRELYFAAPRKFRADFVVTPTWETPFPPALIIEVEGAVWTQGRHTRGEGFESGCEKQALAVLAGYKYLRVTPRQVDDGTALEWIRAILSQEKAA